MPVLGKQCLQRMELGAPALYCCTVAMTRTQWRGWMATNLPPEQWWLHIERVACCSDTISAT